MLFTMKKMLIIVLLFITGYTENAQSTDLSNPEDFLVGTWEVQQDKQEIRLKSLVFFTDGTININYPGTNRVQRYKLTKAEQGYNLEILEIISGKPLEKIKILQLSKVEMEIGYEDETRKLAVRLKKSTI
jgi:hypothetical protein